MNNLFLIGIAQALFFSLFLITKKENPIANRLLATLLILISFSLFLNYSYSTGLIQKIPFIIGLDTTFPFVYGPILYLYAKILVAKKQKLSYKEFLHLVPFCTYFIYVFFKFYIRSNTYKLEFLEAMRNFEVPPDITVANYLKILQAIVYLLFTLQLIYKHQKSIRSEFSYTDNIHLNWLKILTYSLISVYVFKFSGILITFFIDEIKPGEIEVLTDLSAIIFIYIVAFGGIKQPDIFKKWHIPSTEKDSSKKQPSNTDTRQKAEQDQSTDVSKYLGSPLSAEESRQLLAKLQNMMDKEKIFLENELTIKDIADKLEINVKYLSQVINEQLGRNFFNFINEYRIEEVKKRLTDKKYQHLSILGIAFDCGFNSKSSFNSIFKQATGETPRSYISANS